MSDAGPSSLGEAIAQLVAMRGYARREAASQLTDVWNAALDGRWPGETRPLRISRGTLHVSVSNAPLLSELMGFHAASLVKRLGELDAGLKIRKLKFELE